MTYAHRGPPIKIEKDVPLPQNKRGCPRINWRNMCINDSFLCAYPNPKPPRELVEAGWRFTVRQINPKSHPTPYRIWRTA